MSSNLSGWWHTRRAPTHTFAWFLNEVILWGHVISERCYINTSRRPMDTNLDNGLTYREWLPLLELHDPFIPQPKREQLIIWKTYRSPLSQDLWPLNLKECWLWEGASPCKCLSCHQFLLYFFFITMLLLSKKWQQMEIWITTLSFLIVSLLFHNIYIIWLNS